MVENLRYKGSRNLVCDRSGSLGNLQCVVTDLNEMSVFLRPCMRDRNVLVLKRRNFQLLEM